ncbi:hypothetical protein RIVM261_075100 [Rivularia sp. IAM M-261]|nr:hypothetical protein CAL7716_039530 [Calothrix sp. PCC 7716]GJD22554.1 hypothetical protein RIVM261_075100 [Rivularia sp. IAM M-261]
MPPKTKSLSCINLIFIFTCSTFFLFAWSNVLVLASAKPKVDKSGALTIKDCLQCEVKYEESLRRGGIEGSVTLVVDVNKNGDVQLVRLARSSGNLKLDEAAITQALEWKFKPSTTERINRRVTIHYAITGSRRHRLLTRSRSEAVKQRLQIIENYLRQRRNNQQAPLR